MTSYTPTVIRRSDPRRVEIEWNDGGRTLYTPAELRGLCPCAQCVNEISGKRMNDPESVPLELEQSDLHMIGNYAISMRFSDGHHTGIYTFKYLRDNDPQAGKYLRENGPQVAKDLRENEPQAGKDPRENGPQAGKARQENGPQASASLRDNHRHADEAQLDAARRASSSPRESDPPSPNRAEGREPTRG